jgi:hypothetical protein
MKKGCYASENEVSMVTVKAVSSFEGPGDEDAWMDKHRHWPSPKVSVRMKSPRKGSTVERTTGNEGEDGTHNQTTQHPILHDLRSHNPIR